MVFNSERFNQFFSKLKRTDKLAALFSTSDNYLKFQLAMLKFGDFVGDSIGKPIYFTKTFSEKFTIKVGGWVKPKHFINLNTLEVASLCAKENTRNYFKIIRSYYLSNSEINKFIQEAKVDA